MLLPQVGDMWPPPDHQRPRCADPSELGTLASSLRCQACAEGWLQEEGQGGLGWRCSECRDQVQEKEVITKTLKLASLAQKAAVADIPATVHVMTSLLGVGPLFHSVVELKLRLLEEGTEAMDEERARLVLSYASDICRYMEALNPGVSKLRGRLLFGIAKAQGVLVQGRGGTEEEAAVARREVLKLQMQAHRMISGHCS